MNFKNLFKKPQNRLETSGSAVNDGLQICPECSRSIPKTTVRLNSYVCPLCGYYFRLTPRQRLSVISDGGDFHELFGDVKRELKFDFPGYEEKLAQSEKKTGDYDAVVCGLVKIGGRDAVVFIMNGSFIMGSMGTVAGEKITRCFEYAVDIGLPVVGVTVSGGARMQEGIFSLMQMAKVSGAIKRHSDCGLLYITLLTDPTTGGVSASLAMLGDIIIAEPKALVCFAGPRVIEQTLRQKLPDNFQRAEALLADGFIDGIVERQRQHEYLAAVLKLHDVSKTDVGRTLK